MDVVRLKYSTILVSSVVAIFAVTGCAHDTRYAVASGGGGGGGAAPPVDDGGGSAPDPAPPAAEPEPVVAQAEPGGLQSTTTAASRSIGNVILSSGNTVKTLANQTPGAARLASATDQLMNVGGAMSGEGLSGLPVVGTVTDQLIPALDRATAPAAKITLLNANTVGSGAANSVQALGIGAGSTNAVQGTLASLNVTQGTFLAPGAAVSADVAGGQVVSASFLPQSVGQPLQVDSLANISIGGMTLVPGGNSAAINLNALPNGLSGGLGGLQDVANLSSIMSPGTAGPLAPVVGLVQSVTGLATEAVGGVTSSASGAGLGGLGGLGGQSGAGLTTVLAPLTSLLPTR